eukprot:376147-Rhodomonas_salina.1
MACASARVKGLGPMAGSRVQGLGSRVQGLGPHNGMLSVFAARLSGADALASVFRGAGQPGE